MRTRTRLHVLVDGGAPLPVPDEDRIVRVAGFDGEARSTAGEEPVGKVVIHLCDDAVDRLQGYDAVRAAFEEALEDYETCVEMGSNGRNLRSNQAKSLVRLGRDEEALQKLLVELFQSDTNEQAQ